jgi:hypothetical protein
MEKTLLLQDIMIRNWLDAIGSPLAIDFTAE